jgi:hypothetical protein
MAFTCVKSPHHRKCRHYDDGTAMITDVFPVVSACACPSRFYVDLPVGTSGLLYDMCPYTGECGEMDDINWSLSRRMELPLK